MQLCYLPHAETRAPTGGGPAANANATRSEDKGQDTHTLPPITDVHRKEHADAIICTGLIDDETETPDDYKNTLLDAKNRDLPMLCANPDIIVDRGDKRIFCAGALAAAYDKIGGRVDYAGKPHAPIYRLALAKLTAIHQNITPADILCIGDGIHTDIAGATAQSMPCVFITGGLAARQTDTRADPLSTPNPAKLGEFLINQPCPTYAIGRLR